MTKHVSLFFGLSIFAITSGCGESQSSDQTDTAGGATSQDDLALRTGRRRGSGGTSATGGTVGSGGSSSAGGTGGVVATGGVTGTGGRPATGGSGGGVTSCLPQPTGIVHYFCDCGTGHATGCVAGSDSNSGTSSASPWQTANKLANTFDAAAAGDQMLLCKGGAFSQSGANNSFVNGKCTATSRCSIGAYAAPWNSGGEGRPILYGIGSGRSMALDDGGNADHEGGYVFDGLELNGGTVASDGIFMYNDVDDVLICNMYIHGFAQGIQKGGANTPNAGADRKNVRTYLKNSIIKDNSAQGWLGFGDGDQILNNTFQNNGFALATFNHNIYLNAHGSDGGADSMLVQGNDLYQSAVVSGTCQGVSLVAHGVHTSLSIIGNKIHEDAGTVSSGCYGIAVVSGYGGDAESFSNVTIRGNTVVGFGGASIAVQSCANCSIENNIITTGQNLNVNAVVIQARSEGIDGLSSAVVVRNNAIYLDRVTAIEFDEGSGHKVYNNWVWFAGSGAVGCFSMEQGGLPGSVSMDYNKCYAPSGTFNWTNGNSLATWQATGLDAHSTFGNPGITTAGYANFDFHAASGGSAIVDTGSTANGSTSDLSGVTRSVGSATDIGPYER